MAKECYRREIGHLLVDSIRWIPVVGFYLFYAGGIVAFVVYPAIKSDSWQYALLCGVFFRLLTYGAYDLTNLATLKKWPPLLAFLRYDVGSFCQMRNFIYFISFKRFHF